MSQDSAAQEPAGQASAAQPHGSAYSQFWKHPHAVVLVGLVGLILNVVIVMVLGGLADNDDAERVHALQVDGNRYALYFHRTARPYHTAEKNGVRVFDSRGTEASACVRLKRRDDGLVTLECLHRRRHEAVVLPLP